MTRIRVFIVDDHPLFRKALKDCLTGDDVKDIEIVGEAGTTQDALDQIAQLLPSVILMDLAFPHGVWALDAIQVIRRAYPEQRILVVSGHGDPEIVWTVMRMAVAGYFLKEELTQDIVINTVRSVADGAVVLSEQIQEVLVHGSTSARERQIRIAASRYGLTARETEILGLIVEGKSNKELRKTLNLADGTLRSHIGNIHDKMVVTNRHEVIEKALKAVFASDDRDSED